MGGMLLTGSAQWRQRQASLAYDRSMIAAANSQLEVAKAHADAKPHSSKPHSTVCPTAWR